MEQQEAIYLATVAFGKKYDYETKVAFKEKHKWFAMYPL